MACSSQCDINEALLSVCDSDSDTSESEETAESIEVITTSASILGRVLDEITQDEVVTNSSLGSSVLSTIRKCLENSKSSEMVNFEESVTKEIKHLLYGTGKANKRRMKLSVFWKNFHALRLSPSIQSAWHACVTSLSLPEAAEHMTLQVILKRLIGKTIQATTAVSPEPKAQELTRREENVIRYMCGYVVLKIKKKFTICSEFVDSLQTGFDFIGVESLQDYTKVWTEQVERGGLYHVHDNFFNLVIGIEHVCRKYLNTNITPGDNLISRIKSDCLQSTHITQLWSDVASFSTIPQNEVLSYICCLWSTIRVYAFARKWTDLLTKSHAKSIRKTLKRKGTEKEDT